MNTTFVLGAGFSADAGFPLARELRERCLSFIEFERHPAYSQFLNAGNGGFEEGQFHAGLKEVDPNGKLAFEELLLALGKCVNDPQYDGPCVQTQWTLRLGCSRLFWCTHGWNPFPEPAYRNFACRLGNLLSRGITIVCFNWDVVVEPALTEAAIPWSYSLAGRQEVAILKPHGSINWNGYLRVNCRAASGEWRRISNQSKLSFLPNQPLKNPGQQEVNPDFRFVLFPGDPDLPKQDPDVKLIWEDVKQAVANSERVVFIGYSLPGYDSFAAAFLEQHTRGKIIEVDDPSPSDQEKYVRLFGDRVRRQGGNFASSPFASE